MIIINNRDKIEYKNGMTVQNILDEMGYSYVLITVTVNNELVPEEEYKNYKINDNDSVGIFHLAHGG